MNYSELKEKMYKLQMKYGFLPYLMLMQECEDREQYEVCAIILDVLQANNKKYGLDIPTKYNDEAIAYFLRACRNEPNGGYVALQNCPHYVAELKKECNFSEVLY